MDHEYKVPIDGAIYVSAGDAKEAAVMAKRWAEEINFGMGAISEFNNRHDVIWTEFKPLKPTKHRVYQHLEDAETKMGGMTTEIRMDGSKNVS